MREIKFRAWMHWENQMIFSAISPEMFIFASNGLNLKTVSDQLYYPRVSFMQATGLKDKNGKEIYEGDILTRSRMIFSVHFGTSAFGVSLHSGGKSFASNWDLVGGREEGEIIGNIHENPELLR